MLSIHLQTLAKMSCGKNKFLAEAEAGTLPCASVLRLTNEWPSYAPQGMPAFLTALPFILMVSVLNTAPKGRAVSRAPRLPRAVMRLQEDPSTLSESPCVVNAHMSPIYIKQGW